ncbi:AraC family transcriptional regulator [Pseudomaricurvus alkylphenolicus]|uniref:AraC family transcriptional regulator n=1 Tax=Pseudomaricurvus alkylphenolicus TaxID=1306991 RepID=UPI00141DE3AB|nr:AraC family transcriptional regulator [Pseudomaricurvus alkylphenolicus]NIB41734.1 AraC family transcriptional regulator [Pseudomaricurvus alkylphenolicus]
MNSGPHFAAMADTPFGPVLELLQDELEAVGDSLHLPTRALSPHEFSQCYLEVVQRLEQHVAGSDSHAPNSRKEVELMCRCTLSASTLGEAMALVCDFASMLYPRAGDLHIIKGEETVKFTQNSVRGERTVAADLVDITGLFAFKQLFHWLVNGLVQPMRVCIGSISREDVLPFLQLFNTSVLTGGDVNFLEYDKRDLDKAVIVTPGDFQAFFEVFPCGVFEPTKSELVQQVSALISASVHQALPIPSLVQIAKTVDIPSSTFRRQLADQDTSYREIRDQCLMDIACDYLAQTDLPVGQLANRLGFRNTTTFRQAFRRWTGYSPSDWRANHTAN